MTQNTRIGRWLSGLLLSGALCGLLVPAELWSQGGRGGGGGGGGGPRGRGGPGGGGPGGQGGAGFRGAPGLNEQGGGQGGQPGGPGGPGFGGGGGGGAGFGGGPGGVGGAAGGGGGRGGQGLNCQDMVSKAMTMDQNGDGMLTANEVPDPRLHGMMSIADTDANGVVTQDELTIMFTRQMAQQGNPGGGFGPQGGPGMNGRGPGMGGPGGPSQSGEVFPGFLQDELGLNEQQRGQLADLQKFVDKRILSILNREQRARFKEMKARGPEAGPAGEGRGPATPPADPDSGRPRKDSEKPAGT